MKKLTCLTLLTAFFIFNIFSFNAYAYEVENDDTISVKYISTVEDLMDIEKSNADKFVLTNDIDMNNQFWQAIINFDKIFDGQGHTISNFYSNDFETAMFYQILENGVVKNLTIQGHSLGGSCSTFAFKNYGAIINCCNKCTQFGVKASAGIAVYNYGFISSCKNIGSIKGSERASGIAVWNYGILENCFNFSAVKSNSKAAGINIINRGEISNCTNRKTIKSKNASAGISILNKGLIKDCINQNPILGKVSAGICIENAESITECTNTGDIRGTIDSANEIYLGYEQEEAYKLNNSENSDSDINIYIPDNI